MLFCYSLLAHLTLLTALCRLSHADRAGDYLAHLASPPSLFQPIVVSPLLHLPPLPLTSSSPSLPVSFNDSLSQCLLLFSSAAYSTSPSTCIASKLPSASFQLTHSFNASLYGSSLYGFAGVGLSPAPFLVFAFQGSMSSSQLYEELRHSTAVPPANSTDLLVNSYFWHAAQLLFPAVAAAVHNLTSHLHVTAPAPAIYFTGHSLGAALATLLALLLVTQPTPLPSTPILYTFGEPRIGNFALSQVIRLALPRHHRVVHWRDAVPHLPPCPTTLDPVTRVTVCSASNGTDRYYAYHSPLEVLYSEAMPQWGGVGGKGVAVRECDGAPAGEDQTCGDAFDWWSLDDHYTYYQVDVGEFCLAPHERPLPLLHPLPGQSEAQRECGTVGCSS